MALSRSLYTVVLLAAIAMAAAGGAPAPPAAATPRKLLAPAGPAAAAPAAAPLITIVSARLLSCEWPKSLSDAGGGSAAGLARVAAVAVECIYADAHTSTRAAPPAAVPAVMAVSGMPLEQCALGARLRLPYLLRLRAPPAPALPGAPREVVSSTPLVGARLSAEQQLGGRIVEKQCFVGVDSHSGWVGRGRGCMHGGALRGGACAGALHMHASGTTGWVAAAGCGTARSAAAA